MKLPAKVEYAVKALVELALRYNGESPVHISVISETQDIPKGFLLQLLIRLKNAGLVNSSRGITGGYFLTKQPSQITLADIFKAVDNNIIDKPKQAKVSRRLDANKLILLIWNNISSEVAKSLGLITLESLVAQIKNEQLTYYI